MNGRINEQKNTAVTSILHKTLLFRTVSVTAEEDPKIEVPYVPYWINCCVLTCYLPYTKFSQKTFAKVPKFEFLQKKNFHVFNIALNIISIGLYVKAKCLREIFLQVAA